MRAKYPVKMVKLFFSRSKARIALKELRETEVNLRIMRHVNYGGEQREKLHEENIELIKILVTIIKNRQNKKV